MITPGPDHPITVTPTSGRVTVRVGDRVVADSTAALDLQEADYPVARYLPLAHVDPALIKPSDTTTYCPYKGTATYYSIVTDDGELTDAIWTYLTPYPAVEQIAGHVAFYPDRVEISAPGS